MGIFSRFFKRKTQKDVEFPPVEKTVPEENKLIMEKWEELPGFIPAPKEEYRLVSVIATAIAAEDSPNSQFIVKKILKRNPEAKTVALIAASLASEVSTGNQLQVTKILKKTN